MIITFTGAPRVTKKDTWIPTMVTLDQFIRSNVTLFIPMFLSLLVQIGPVEFGTPKAVLLY